MSRTRENKEQKKDPWSENVKHEPRAKSAKGDKLLDAYLKEIRRYPLLSREQERSLALRVKNHDDAEARKKLIISNLRLVVKIAFGFQRHWTENVLDLIQQGNLGLIKAAERFDPDKKVKFSHYSAFWIRSYIYKFLMDNWKMVKIGTTQNQRKLFFGLIREREKLLAQGVSPEPRILAERLDVKQKEVVEMNQRLFSHDISIDSGTRTPHGESYANKLPDASIDIETDLENQETMNFFIHKIDDFKNTLNARELDIFAQRMFSETPITLRRLGEKYNISRERVRQIQVDLTGRIRDIVEEEISPYR